MPPNPLLPDALENLRPQVRQAGPGTDALGYPKHTSSQNSKFRYTRREEEGIARQERMDDLPKGFKTPYKDIQGNVVGQMTAGKKDITGKVTGRYNAGSDLTAQALSDSTQEAGSRNTIGGMPSLTAAKTAGRFGSGGSGSLLADPSRQKGFISIGKSFGFTVGQKPEGPKPATTDTTFLKEGQEGFFNNAADDGGEVRSLNGRLDDHVFNGNMSDKDRQTVMRAMVRRHGARGALV